MSDLLCINNAINLCNDILTVISKYSFKVISLFYCNCIALCCKAVCLMFDFITFVDCLYTYDFIVIM